MWEMNAKLNINCMCVWCLAATWYQNHMPWISYTHRTITFIYFQFAWALSAQFCYCSEFRINYIYHKWYLITNQLNVFASHPPCELGGNLQCTISVALAAITVVNFFRCHYLLIKSTSAWIINYYMELILNTNCWLLVVCVCMFFCPFPTQFNHLYKQSCVFASIHNKTPPKQQQRPKRLSH